MSPNTVASYCHDVEAFLEAVDLAPRAVTSEDIERYLGKVTAGGLSKRHISTPCPEDRTLFVSSDCAYISAQTVSIRKADNPSIWKVSSKEK